MIPWFLMISSGLPCQSLPGPAVRNRCYDDEEIIVNLQTVPEAFRQRPEMFHLGQCVLHHDAHAGQLLVDQLLVLCQGMVPPLPPRLVGRCHTMLRQVLVQAIETGISQHAYLSWYPIQDTQGAEMAQVVHRSGHGWGHRSNQALFVDDNSVLGRVPFLLARVEDPLPPRIPRSSNGLLRPVRDGEQIGVRGRRFCR